MGVVIKYGKTYKFENGYKSSLGEKNLPSNHH